MHKAHLVHSDRPIVITVIDTPENIERLVPIAVEMIDTGLIGIVRSPDGPSGENYRA